MASDEVSTGAAPPRVPRRAVAPLYAAGFTTAFGAHTVAAGLGAETGDAGIGLLTFGIVLALYDIAEVILKPVFGTLSDRIGPKPVIVGGLVLFSVASVLGVFAGAPLLIGLSRLGQGAGAAAFSPASSAAVARLAGPGSAGRYFGRYGSWKGLGYTVGPLLGAALIGLGSFPILFLALAVVSAGAAGWAALALPRIPPLPRPRYTVIDLLKQTTARSFLIPTMALAAATGALGVAVGFLPLLGSRLGLPVLASMAAVTVLALASSLTQPAVGRLRDAGTLSTRTGVTLGLGTIAIGVILLAVAPSAGTLYLSAVLIGLGVGTTTPLGFAHLAATTPHERMGRTMGNAELGREIGDAGGPLLVGAVATTATLAAGFGALALVVAGVAATCSVVLRPRLSGEAEAGT